MRHFFFNDTATTEIYTLSLHDALPIWGRERGDETRSLLEVAVILSVVLIGTVAGIRLLQEEL